MQTKRKLLVAGVALAVNTQLVGAATHTVTIGADAGVGSLRAAIEAASSGDIIKIDSGLSGGRWALLRVTRGGYGAER